MTTLDKEHCFKLIAEDPGAWMFKSHIQAHDLIINDIDIAKACLKKDGMLLKYCTEEFKDDYDLATIAVTSNGMALDYVSKRLQDNDDIVKIAMKLNQAVCFASNRIKSDKNFALLSFRYNPNDIRFYSKEIRDICGNETGLLSVQTKVQNLKKAIEVENLANQLHNDLSYKSNPTVKVKI